MLDLNQMLICLSAGIISMSYSLVIMRLDLSMELVKYFIIL